MERIKVSGENYPQDRTDRIINYLDSYTHFLTLDIKTTSAASILDACMKRRDALLELLRLQYEDHFSRTEKSTGLVYDSLPKTSTLLEEEEEVVTRARDEVRYTGEISLFDPYRLLGIVDIEEEAEEFNEAEEFIAAVLSLLPPERRDQQAAKLAENLMGHQRDIGTFYKNPIYADRQEELKEALDIAKFAPNGEEKNRALQILGVFYWYTGLDRNGGTYSFKDILEMIDTMTDTSDTKFDNFRIRVIEHLNRHLPHQKRKQTS